MSEGWVAAKIVFCPSRGHVQEIKLPTGANMRKWSGVIMLPGLATRILQEFCWCDKSESLLIQQASGTEFLGTFLLHKFKVINTHGTFPLHAPKTDPYCRSTCVNRAQFCQPLKCAHFYYPRDKHMEFTWIVFTEWLVGTASFSSWYSVIPWSETSQMKMVSFVTIRGFGNRKMSHFFLSPHLLSWQGICLHVIRTQATSYVPWNKLKENVWLVLFN